MYSVENKDISSEHLLECEYNMNIVNLHELCDLSNISCFYFSSAFHCLVLNLLIFHFEIRCQTKISIHCGAMSWKPLQMMESSRPKVLCGGEY